MTAAQLSSVSAAADQISRNVQTAAAGAEQMGESIREVAASASAGPPVWGPRPRASPRPTTTTVARLGESSTEIGNVVNLIPSIAQQTNLLALNATIEAPRRRGRKGLRRRRERGENELRRSVTEAADGAGDIARTVATIADAVQSATGGVSEVSDAARELALVATGLQSCTSRYTLAKVGGVDGDERSAAAAVSGTVVLSQPGTLTMSVIDALGAVVMAWEHQSDAAFRPAVERQLELINERRLDVVIVDTSRVTGTLSDATQQWIAGEFFPRMSRSTVRVVVAIVPSSAIARMVNGHWQGVGNSCVSTRSRSRPWPRPRPLRGSTTTDASPRKSLPGRAAGRWGWSPGSGVADDRSDGWQHRSEGEGHYACRCGGGHEEPEGDECKTRNHDREVALAPGFDLVVAALPLGWRHEVVADVSVSSPAHHISVFLRRGRDDLGCDGDDLPVASR
jgi:Methyl-accepting chemotaxis protein (MCP) signalling domain